MKRALDSLFMTIGVLIGTSAIAYGMFMGFCYMMGHPKVFLGLVIALLVLALWYSIYEGLGL